MQHSGWRAARRHKQPAPYPGVQQALSADPPAAATCGAIPERRRQEQCEQERQCCRELSAVKKQVGGCVAHHALPRQEGYRRGGSGGAGGGQGARQKELDQEKEREADADKQEGGSDHERQAEEGERRAQGALAEGLLWGGGCQLLERSGAHWGGRGAWARAEGELDEERSSHAFPEGGQRDTRTWAAASSAGLKSSSLSQTAPLRALGLWVSRRGWSSAAGGRAIRASDTPLRLPCRTPAVRDPPRRPWPPPRLAQIPSTCIPEQKPANPLPTPPPPKATHSVGVEIEPCRQAAGHEQHSQWVRVQRAVPVRGEGVAVHVEEIEIDQHTPAICGRLKKGKGEQNAPRSSGEARRGLVGLAEHHVWHLGRREEVERHEAGRDSRLAASGPKHEPARCPAHTRQRAVDEQLNGEAAERDGTCGASGRSSSSRRGPAWDSPLDLLRARSVRAGGQRLQAQGLRAGPARGTPSVRKVRRSIG
eukprot:scaffold1760_cov109-Isochrysis_galbana.AAC.2